MAQKRKTQSERYQERYDAERRAWEQFQPKLANLQSYQEALELLISSPRIDTPGRQYYSNLGFFLGNFIVPANSNYEERSLYLQFIQRIKNSRTLKPEALKRIETDLQSALKDHV